MQMIVKILDIMPGAEEKKIIRGNRVPEDREVMDPLREARREAWRALKDILRQMGIPEEEIGDAAVHFSRIRKGLALSGTHLKELSWIAERALFIQEVPMITLRVSIEEDGLVRIDVKDLGDAAGRDWIEGSTVREIKREDLLRVAKWALISHETRAVTLIV